MLRDCAWREVKKARVMEAEGRSKLGMVNNLMEGGVERGVYSWRGRN